MPDRHPDRHPDASLEALRALIGVIDDGGLQIAKGAARPVVLNARAVIIRADMLAVMQQGLHDTIERMTAMLPSNVTALPAPAPPPGPDPRTRDLLLQALNMSERYGGMTPEELAWREKAKEATGFSDAEVPPPGPRAVP